MFVSEGVCVFVYEREKEGGCVRGVGFVILCRIYDEILCWVID